MDHRVPSPGPRLVFQRRPNGFYAGTLWMHSVNCFELNQTGSRSARLSCVIILLKIKVEQGLRDLRITAGPAVGRFMIRGEQDDIYYDVQIPN